MSVEVERATLPCSVCGASVSELRRGRCWGCYTRWAESRPVGRGAACVICNEKRRAQLKLVEIWRRSLPFCHGCAAQVMRLPDLPGTIEEVRHALRRDRRDADRRNGKVDQRIFPRERRVGERRGPVRDAFADTDPRIKLADLQMDEVVLELGEADLEPGDQTQVRPSAPRTAAAAQAAGEPANEVSVSPPDAPASELSARAASLGSGEPSPSPSTETASDDSGQPSLAAEAAAMRGSIQSSPAEAASAKG